MQFAILIASLAIGAIATPAPPMTTQAPSARAVEKRLTIPKSAGSTALAAVSTILAGKTFDGGMVMYDRGKSCTGQAEGGDKDAVFIVQKGATLKNVIIGPNQIEGVHCLGACTIENVWWTNVCEDALTVKNQAASETTVSFHTPPSPPSPSCSVLFCFINNANLSSLLPRTSRVAVLRVPTTRSSSTTVAAPWLFPTLLSRTLASSTAAAATVALRWPVT